MNTQVENDAGRVSAGAQAVKTYRPQLEKLEATADRTVFDTIPLEIFANKKAFINMARKGIPGSWVKVVVDATGFRDTFLSILNVSSGNLSREYRKKALAKETSEEVLDAVRLIRQAVDVWESRELAIQWLNSPVSALDGENPINLFDTFEGRQWVSQVLNKIEHGDFS
ncbi:putative toxin-antitoxin system antitoxin component, TIGR02293 family [Marinobacter sp. LV10R510-11A]|uniref:antitoxin Xre/MbcA/ParS toxin-binding domain-containing protein n=1 Tax=Marinobacter sp. LV10R510-11A TaxID=1415568 RepID=UPI000BB821A7|nr:MbcA/ParS/Xre antitoxin family protein [Marinobacter sp. LV10R510-11A]SOB74779.1 putative toxin-antitoxin system antitoxin component, TIGR02293 family [Marinobacter sp. LV10R510-11A]